MTGKRKVLLDSSSGSSPLSSGWTWRRYILTAPGRRKTKSSCRGSSTLVPGGGRPCGAGLQDRISAKTRGTCRKYHAQLAYYAKGVGTAHRETGERKNYLFLYASGADLAVIIASVYKGQHGAYCPLVHRR